MEQVIVIDADLRARLRNLSVSLELRDEDGRVLGHFQPAFLPADTDELLRSCPVSEEELKLRGQSIEGRPLADIWKRLGRTS